MSDKTSDRAAPGAAERLLDTASRLFYTRGVSNVGINEIIARAGVARMTLYHHFPSKDALIKAVLERRREERDAWNQGWRSEVWFGTKSQPSASPSASVHGLRR